MDKNKRHRLLRLMVSTFLTVCLAGTSLYAQSGNITGTVTDAVTGEPLLGVTVTIPGTNTGTVTGVDGRYSISAREGQSLSFQYVGYQQQSVNVGAARVYDMKLNQDSRDIEAVVVMGYGGFVNKVDAIGAVGQMNSVDIERRAPTNIFDAIRGEMAGVRITSTSGAPGESMNIRVRGMVTMSEDGVEPLYVVDGFIVDDISNINPNDVETINILKDAASAAVYGARAAAGVVMVTTKSGKPGMPKVTVSYNQKFGWIANTLPQLNRKEADIASRTIFSYGSKNQFDWLGTTTDSVNMSNQTANFYQDMISRTGVSRQLDISARGGGDDVRYAVSTGILSETGVILKSANQRATFRGKMDYIPNKVMTLTTNLSLEYTDRDAVNDGQIYNNATRRMPQTWIYFPTDGSYVPTWGSYPNTGKRNPLAEIYERDDNSKRYRANLSQQVQVNILPELSFTGNVKGNFYMNQRNLFIGEWIRTSSMASFQNGENELQRDDTFYKNWSTEAFFNYSKVFCQDHTFSAMAGTSLEYTNTNTIARGGKFLAFLERPVTQYTDDSRATLDGGTTSSMASFFGRVMYDYQKRYLFSATFRYDGSSRFGPENKWGFFPSMQLGWRFSDYFQDSKVGGILTDGKLRLSWGITGNDRVGDFDWMPLYNGGATSGYNGAGGTGVVQAGTPGNINLQWEQTRETNFGVDLQFFKRRLLVEVDHYIQKTTKLLDDEPLPSELGYSSMRVNVGTVKNRGWEIMLNGYPVDTKDWTWQSSLTWSTNHNTVVDIAGIEGKRIYDTNWWVEEGRTAGLWYGFRQLGVYAYDANNAYTADFSERLLPVFKRDDLGNVQFDSNQRPQVTGYTYQDGTPFEGTPTKLKIAGTDALGGDVIWEDYNRDGVINDNDKQVLGDAHPKWFLGWNNNVRWKNLSLNFSFYYSHGGLLYNDLLYQLTRFGDNTSAPDPRTTLQGWRYQGHITEWHIPGQGSQNGRNTQDNGRSLSSFYLEDGSFLRLSDARIAYDFDRDWLKKYKLTQLQLYVYGSNLLTWTNYRGYDPEVGGGTVLSPGRDSGRYPKQRTVGFGVTVGF